MVFGQSIPTPTKRNMHLWSSDPARVLPESQNSPVLSTPYCIPPHSPGEQEGVLVSMDEERRRLVVRSPSGGFTEEFPWVWLRYKKDSFCMASREN